MIIPKYTPSELRRNMRYILLDPKSWLILFNQFIINMGDWKKIESSVKDDYSVLRNDRLGITFYSNLNYGRIIISEWEIWNKFYRFPFSLLGKTVLDVGAGCGESALFFSLCKAEKVICIEKNLDLIRFIEENRKTNSLNWDIINEPFNLSHLKLKFDAIKMDIEGCESELLNLVNIPSPMVLEVHSQLLFKEFSRRGFKTSKVIDSKNRIVLMNNFFRGSYLNGEN